MDSPDYRRRSNPFKSNSRDPQNPILYQPAWYVSQDKLCAICNSFPFDLVRQKEVTDETPLPKLQLGTLHQIKVRARCPLCRLIIQAFSDRRISVNKYWSGGFEEKHAVYAEWFTWGQGFHIYLLPIGSRLCLIEGPNARGRLVTKADIELSLISEWLRTCRSHHPECASPSLQSQEDQMSTFRLIDVRQLCVVESSHHVEFVALSYVWGRTETCRLLLSNKDKLILWGGLIEYWNQIPQTIKDAIQLTQRLGQRYLWVDSLCLIQDEKQDLRNGIYTMDLVYEQAIFTIVAASGSDAYSGLPGVRKNSRVDGQIIGKINSDVKMVVVHELEALLRNSEYSNRAWTFQEYFLSPRKLVFLNNQVYFHCQRCVWSEETNDDQNFLSRNQNAESLLFEIGHDPDYNAFDQLTNIIEYYSWRKLTYQTDALNALAGISRRFSKRMKCRFLSGLPVATFDMSILFFRSPREGESPELHRRKDFPSYSWAGWSGSIKYVTIDGDKNEWLTKSTWIIWYKKSQSGVLSPVWDLAANDAFLDITSHDIGYRKRNPFPQSRNLSMRTSRTTPSQDISKVTLCPYPILQFWTMATYYTLHQTEEYLYHDENTYNIFDRYNYYCGYLSLDSSQNIWEPGQPLEFIVLSQSQEMMARSSMDYLSAGSAGDPTKVTWAGYTPDKLYWVMLVQWQDGAAERRGLGQIYQNALAASFPPGPLWKEVVLG